MHNLFGALRLALFSIIICSGFYTLVVWGFAQLITPKTANGHLIRNQAGIVIGSRQIAQPFTSAKYFYNRPSAVNYDGSKSGGSNFSPASPELRIRAKILINRYGATWERPLPADLATASGSGLDPHISLAAAQFQIPRIAKARGLSQDTVDKMVMSCVVYPGGFLISEPIVNVLELNCKLDDIK